MMHSIILALCGAMGLSAMARAEPLEPHKVPTLTIRAQPAGDPSPALAPPADYPAIQTLKVQPPPGEDRGPSVHRFGDGRETGHGTAKADTRAIRTIPIGPDTGTRFDLDRHFAPRPDAPRNLRSGVVGRWSCAGCSSSFCLAGDCRGRLMLRARTPRA